VPLLPGARRLAEQGIAPAGSLKNLETARAALDPADGVSETDLVLLADAQTSGGLLLTMPVRDAGEFAKVSRLAGDAGASEIGRIVEGGPGRVRVTP
jgi:selenide,water dikinase